MFTSILFLSYISYLFHIELDISIAQIPLNTLMKIHSEIMKKKCIPFNIFLTYIERDWGDLRGKPENIPYQ